MALAKKKQCNTTYLVDCVTSFQLCVKSCCAAVMQSWFLALQATPFTWGRAWVHTGKCKLCLEYGWIISIPLLMP